MMSPAIPDHPVIDPVESAEVCWFPFRSSGRPVLYYLPDVSGSVLPATSLIRELSDDVDVIGFQAFGLGWDCQPDRTVEDMAARYLSVLLDRDPGGPYVLFGYSMGALVAFEMAAQFGQRGAAPIKVLMIDPPPPASIVAPSKGAVVTAMARSIGLPRFTVADADDVEPVLPELVRQAIDAELLPADYTVDDLRPSVAVRWANAQASARYRPPGRIAGPIAVVSACAERLPAQVDGWMPYTSDRVAGYLVSSDHFSIITATHATAVAAIMRRWLAET